MQQHTAFTTGVTHLDNVNIQCGFNIRPFILPCHQRNTWTAELPNCDPVIIRVTMFADQYRNCSGMVDKANALQLILGELLIKWVYHQHCQRRTSQQQVCCHTVIQCHFHNRRNYIILTGCSKGIPAVPDQNSTGDENQNKQQLHGPVCVEEKAMPFHSAIHILLLISRHSSFLLSQSPRPSRLPYTESHYGYGARMPARFPAYRSAPYGTAFPEEDYW